MSDCECLPRCPFFNDRMTDMPAMAGMMKRRYCQGEFHTCARFQVMKALGSSRVPTDLFPNMNDRAEELIQQG